MDRNITVSLVIPTYNRAALVCNTVASALAQTVPFSEIIIVDDASTDDTVIALRRFGNNTKVLQNGKLGLQSARNAGANAAVSEYITFCDSDDLLEAEFLETLKKWLAANERWESVYFNYRSFSTSCIDNDILANAPSDFFTGACHVDAFITHVPDLYVRTVNFQPLLASGVTVRKDFFQVIGGFNPVMNGIASEDWEYTLRAIGNGRTAICTKPLVKIRHHAGNQSRHSLRQVLGEIEIIKFALENHPVSEQYRDELLKAVFRRRHHVFYESFRTRQLAFAALVFQFLKAGPNTIGFRIKAFVLQTYLMFFRPDAEKLIGFSVSPDKPTEKARFSLRESQAAS